MKHDAARSQKPPLAPKPSGATFGPLQTLEQRIDEALEETFPASDPPFWTLGSEGQSKAQLQDR